MVDLERLERQLAFLKEIDKEKQIVRQTWLADGSRKENDSEHAWHMGIMIFLLSECSSQKIDAAKTMLMALIHDIVEIDAGDTYAYDTEGKKTQRQRECKAADRLFGLLPEDQGMYFRGLWEEFEEGQTPEAKFAHTIDNLQPMMLNVACKGKSWKEHKVHLHQIEKRNEHTAEGSEILWNYARTNWIEPYVKNGIIKED